MGWDGCVREICNYLSSASWQQKFEVMGRPVLQPHVTAQFYLESKEKYILEAQGWANPKDVKRNPQPNFGFALYIYMCVCVYVCVYIYIYIFFLPEVLT